MEGIVILPFETMRKLFEFMEKHTEDVGPTFVGDEWSDEKLMEYLDAKLIKQVGNNFAQYVTDDAPRLVLNKLEALRYKLVAMTGVGQTCIWTLHQEPRDKSENEDQEKEISLH